MTRYFAILGFMETLTSVNVFHIMDYMVSRYLEIFREKSDVEQFLNYCQYPLRKTIRYNSLKINKQEFEKVMNENGFKIKE